MCARACVSVCSHDPTVVLVPCAPWVRSPETPSVFFPFLRSSFEPPAGSSTCEIRPELPVRFVTFRDAPGFWEFPFWGYLRAPIGRVSRMFGGHGLAARSLSTLGRLLDRWRVRHVSPRATLRVSYRPPASRPEIGDMQCHATGAAPCPGGLRRRMVGFSVSSGILDPSARGHGGRRVYPATGRTARSRACSSMTLPSTPEV